MARTPSAGGSEGPDRDRRPSPGDGLGAAGLAFDGLDEVVGLHLRMAQATVSREFLELLAPLELTQKQTAVLWLVGANPGVSQIDLATTLNMDRATMMAIVDRLDARGLVVRKRSAEDGRRRELTLTEAGGELLAQAKAAVATHETRIAARLGGGDTAALIAALKRLQAGD